MQLIGNSVLAVLYLVVVQIAQVVHKSVEMTARVIQKKKVEPQLRRQVVIANLAVAQAQVDLDVKAAAVRVIQGVVVRVAVIVHHAAETAQLVVPMIVMASVKELALMPVQVGVVLVMAVQELVEIQHARQSV